MKEESDLLDTRCNYQMSTDFPKKGYNLIET